MSEFKKFSPMRYTAATENAAVEGALLMAGVSREDADYEVIEQSDKGVTVRIKPREAGTSVAPAPQPEPQAQPEAIDEVQVEAAAESAEVGETEVVDYDTATVAESEDDEEYSEAETEEVETDEVEASEAELETDAPAAVEEEAEEVIEITDEMRDRALETASSFLERMGLDSRVALKEADQPNTIALDVEGEDVGILIGKHGQTLQSFQYLLNLTLNNLPDGQKADKGVRVVVDAGNYKARRQNSLENTAKNAAQRARMSGRPFRLEPMSASERRIVHLYLSRESGISTQSEGREPRRRIVVFPTDSNHSTYDRQEARASRRGMGNYGGRGRGGRR